MLLKYTPAFLDLLAEMRDVMKIKSEIIPCYSLLLEGPDGKQFPMEAVRTLLARHWYTITATHSVFIRCCSSVIVRPSTMDDVASNLHLVQPGEFFLQTSLSSKSEVCKVSNLAS